MKNFTKLLAIIFFTGLSLNSYSQYDNAIKIRIEGNGYADETVVRLIDGATTGFDGMYDAWKLFSPNTNVPSIYSEITVGQELAINSLPEFKKDTSITLYTNIPANGSYLVTITEIYPMSSSYKISLSDLTSNTDYRILNDTSLTFNYNTQQSAPTFTFNISTSANFGVTNESCFAMNDGELTVNNEGNNDWSLTIYDLANNLIANKVSTSYTSVINNLQPGNYHAIVSSKGIDDDYNFAIVAAPHLSADFHLSADTIYLSDGGEAIFTSTCQNAQSLTWDFGDGTASSNQTSPIHYYAAIGDFNVTLTASTNNGCSDQKTKLINVQYDPSIATAIAENQTNSHKILNYGNGSYNIVFNNSSERIISIYDLKGSLVSAKNTNTNSYRFSLANNPKGLYIVSVNNNGKYSREKILR